MSLNSEQPWWLQHPGRNLCVESLLIAQEMCRVVQDAIDLPQIPLNAMVTRKVGCGTHITRESLVFQASERGGQRIRNELLRRADLMAKGIAAAAKVWGVSSPAWCVRYRWEPYNCWHPGGTWTIYVGEPR